jgi:hypothetical protein
VERASVLAATEAAAEPAAPITSPFLVVDDFLRLDVARSLRADIDAHFANPDKHQADTHQVWNYWFVPDCYTYLRTSAEKIIARPKIEGFVGALRNWSLKTLGLGAVTHPYLSLYVDGCSQVLHNDSLNGRFGFVYSLTNAPRKTIGGETLIMEEGDPFRRHLQKPTAFLGFCKAIEPRFNRLLIFDDRLIHGVQRVEGSMDPVEGRFVLHGHIAESGPVVTGARSFEALQTEIKEALDRFIERDGEAAGAFHGPLTVHFTIGADGRVSDLRLMLDRVVGYEEADTEGWEAVRARLLAAFQDVRYPAADGPTTVVFPLLIAG